MIARLWSYIRDKRKWVLLAILLLMGGKVVDVIIPAWLGHLVNQIVDPKDGGVLRRVISGTGWAFLLVLAGYLLDSANVLIMNLIGQSGIYKMRTQVFSHLQGLHLGYFDQKRVGQLVGRTITDIERVERGLSEGLVAALANAVLIIGIVIGMYLVDWRLALIISATLPIMWWMADWFRRQQAIAFRETRAAMGRLNAFVQEHLMGAHVLRHFGLAKSQHEQFQEHNYAFRDASIFTIRNYSRFFAGLDWMHSFLLIAIFVGLAEFGLSGQEFRAGVFFAFSLYLLAFFRPVMDLTERYNLLQEATAAASRVFEVLDVEPRIRTEGDRQVGELKDIAFNDVSFAYKNEEWVLQEISLTLRAGQTVALVGETGAGKTTLSNLLVRFYDPQEGTLSINGYDLRDYSLRTLRSQMSVVLQDPVIFSGTVRDNVSLFDPTIPDEMLIESLKAAEGWELVASLPGQLDARLSEQGKELSGGERQLIALARALAQERPLLILDEATANIDPLTEQRIQRALARILQAKTSLVIAHRLSTVRQADEIIVLDHGQIVERGTHEELLAIQGYYEKLYRLQYVNQT